MTHPNAKLIKDFYAYFAQRDAEGMASCYADDVRFSDPVFTNLQGEEARNMWRMLVERGADLVVSSSGIEADDTTGRARWEATYTFSATGKQVHNIIDARFELRDGKIVVHQDTFDLYRWTRMALGMPGILLGWSGLVQNKVRTQAMSALRHYARERAAQTG